MEFFNSHALVTTITKSQMLSSTQNKMILANVLPNVLRVANIMRSRTEWG
jgi:hypothetical protein